MIATYVIRLSLVCHEVARVLLVKRIVITHKSSVGQPFDNFTLDKFSDNFLVLGLSLHALLLIHINAHS